jgi:hypothetical protein
LRRGLQAMLLSEFYWILNAIPMTSLKTAVLGISTWASGMARR